MEYTPLFFGVDMNMHKGDLKPGMKIKVLWVDGDETEGIFITHERGYIIIEKDGITQACLPNHLERVEIISNA